MRSRWRVNYYSRSTGELIETIKVLHGDDDIIALAAAVQTGMHNDFIVWIWPELSKKQRSYLNALMKRRAA